MTFYTVKSRRLGNAFPHVRSPTGSEVTLGAQTCGVVGLEDVLQLFNRAVATIGKHTVDQLRNFGKCNLAIEETLDGDFICRVEDCRRAPPGGKRVVSKLQTRKAAGIRRFEVKHACARKVQELHACFYTFRVCERVRDRCSHVRIAKLCDHRAIDVFNE